MLALSDTAGAILLVLGARVRRRGRRRASSCAAASPASRHRTSRRAMEPGPSDPRARDAAPAEAPGLGRAARSRSSSSGSLLTGSIEPLDEPRAGEGAEDRRRIERGSRVGRSCSARRTSSGWAASRCHGPELRGGVISVGNRMGLPAEPDDDLRRAHDRAPAHQVARPTSSTTIEQGAERRCRRGASGIQGALDDQQINDIVNYLVYMSSENVPFEDNICINPDAVKAVNSPSASPAAAPSGGNGTTGATGRRAREPSGRDRAPRGRGA